MDEIRDVIEAEESADAKKSENKVDKEVVEARVEARAREERTALYGP